MRDLFLVFIGICLGIAIDRVAGDKVDALLSKSAAGIEAFQSEGQ
jgi:hypothetical protein